MSQHKDAVSTTGGHRDSCRHLCVCIFAPVLISIIVVLESKTGRLISDIRQNIDKSQSEIIIFLIFFLTYFAGFAKARRWSPYAGIVPQVTGTRPSRPKKPPNVTVEPTKTTTAKINLLTTRRLGQWESDAHMIKTIDWECLPSDISTFSELVGASTRLNNIEVTLYLFDHMLKSGVACDLQSISWGTASKFFKLVATNLDDARMQKDGIQLMRAILAHGLSPTNLIQNHLIRSWKSKLPNHVVEIFVEMREKGVHLSATAYRCIMAAHERTEPVFTLRLYDEMLERGIRIDRVAFNAVLCACSHLGMTSQALGLFEQMPDLGLVPNGKTYGTMMRACLSAKKTKEALGLFESMRADGIEPNRFAFRDAIRCCVKLGNFDEAYDLYKDLVAISGAPCQSTCMYMIEACQKHGCPSVADRIQAEMAPMGMDVAAGPWLDFKDSIDSDTA
jgi:pentatricopeptide repeat protein